MEVFMRDISYSVTHHQLVKELAEILHSSRYARFSSVPLNFHVYLFKDKRGQRKHGGSGTLTVPTDDIGRQFLTEYGEPSPVLTCLVGGRRIKFTKSRRQAREEVIQSINHRPYMDPRILEEKEQRDAVLSSERVSITTIQFGWECRDAVFSIEWEETFQNRCFLSFDDDQRELRIKIHTGTSDILIIVIRFSQIKFLSVHSYLSTQPVVFMLLEYPPSFESELEMPTPGTKRQRLSALPLGDHARVAPYISLAMRLVCSSQNDMEKFEKLTRVVKLHNISHDEYYIDRRGLFSAAVIDELQAWLRRLNWCISFQVESLVRSLAVDMKEMLALVPRVRQLVKKKGKRYTLLVLRNFGPRVAELSWNPYDTEDMSVEDCFIQVEEEFAIYSKYPALNPTDASLFEALHVAITPTTMSLEGPFPERSNRVIRRYESTHHESFLRVSFVEEGHLQYRFDRDIDGPAFIQSRVGQLLRQGLRIAGRHFRFLAYSQSALKEHAVWFVKPFTDINHGYIDAPAIIRSLGSFHGLKFDPDLMLCPARYGARLAQAFTATDASVTVEEVEEIFYLDDIKPSEGNYCFTDGVGTMSKELAIEISKELRSKRRRGRHNKFQPRAFQVRFMGSKGMLSVDYKLQGRAIGLRPSMIKFEAPDSLEIEIARAFDRPGPYYLNRPLITLLEGLGVPYEVFEHFQEIAVGETWRSTHSLAEAAKTLESHGLGASYRLTSVMLGLDKLGIDNIYDNSFYQRLLEYAIHDILRSLKNYARIPIPGAWTLVGVADVHEFLKEGEIFACIKPIDGAVRYLEGPVLISRSPTIHPGDVQVVNAIGEPPRGSCFSKEPLPNTVVFSVVGARPLPSCLGGGDLDGDLYNLIPLNKHPNFQPLMPLPDPAVYPQAKKKYTDHGGPSTMDDVANFVMEYINSDVVGIVAINWLILADQSPEGIFDKNCLELARLHNDAVDYPKSGNPVAIQDIPRLRFRQRPDWNAPETVNPDSSRYYESRKAIGRLFRAIDLPAAPEPRKRARRSRKKQTADGLGALINNLALTDADENPVEDVIEARVAQFILLDETPLEIPENMRLLFEGYIDRLSSICDIHTLSRSRPLSEEEAVVGTIIQKSSQPRRRKDLTSKLREQTDILVRGIREELAGNSDTPREDFLERAWLAWKLSRAKRGVFGGESFGWLALGAIFEAIKEIEDEQQAEARNNFY